MQRDGSFHEFDILEQPDLVVGEELDRRHGADAAGVKGRRMNVPAFHQAEHLAGQPAHLESLEIETVR